MKLFRPARSPNPDVTLMILPLPRSSMCGITAREQYIAPVRFVSIPTRHCSSVIASRVFPNPSVAPPALFTRMSIRPNSASDRSTIRCTESESATSQVTARQRRPLSRTNPAVSSICDSVRAVATISAPASASATAIARPNPRPAPVTIATRPSSLNLSRTATVHAFRTSYLVRPNSTSALRPPTSYFLLLISEPRVAPFQRRLQPLLLRPPVELVHHRRLPADRVALSGHALHRPRAHQLHRQVDDPLVRRQQVHVYQRNPVRQRLHLRLEFLQRNRFKHEPRALSFFARNHIARQQHPLGPLRPRQVRPHVPHRRAA